jgi:hypothetical protein
MMALVLAFVPPEVVRQCLQSFGEQIRQLFFPRPQDARKQALTLAR